MAAAKRSGLLTFYLFLYNAASLLGWAWVLYLAGEQMPWSEWQSTLKPTLWNTQKLFRSTHLIVTYVQTGALLEVAHALLGFVQAPVLTTAMQVASRLFLVWGIVMPFGSSVVSDSPVYLTMIFAWSVTEIVRYSYYLTSIIGMGTPSLIVWARYTLFFVLYPMGAGSEWYLVYRSLPIVQKESEWKYYTFVAILAIYIPGFIMLYSYMIKQRKKYLGSAAKGKEAKISSGGVSGRRVKKE